MLFQATPGNFRLLQEIPGYFKLLQVIISYSRLLQAIPNYFRLFQPSPAYSSLCKDIQSYFSLNQHIPAKFRPGISVCHRVHDVSPLARWESLTQGKDSKRVYSEVYNEYKLGYVLKLGAKGSTLTTEQTPRTSWGSQGRRGPRTWRRRRRLGDGACTLEALKITPCCANLEDELLARGWQSHTWRDSGQPEGPGSGAGNLGVLAAGGAWGPQKRRGTQTWRRESGVRSHETNFNTLFWRHNWDKLLNTQKYA